MVTLKGSADRLPDDILMKVSPNATTSTVGCQPLPWVMRHVRINLYQTTAPMGVNKL